MPVSAREPFARVAPHKATQGVLPPGKDYEVFGWQVLGYAPLDGVFYMRKEDAESAASEINAAFADRVAAELEAEAEDVERFEEDAMERLGHHDGTLSNATRERIVAWLRARAKDRRTGATP